MIRTIVLMKIIADTNTFIAVALNEPEKAKIIELTEGHDLIAPDVLPFEIGNALTAMMKKNALKKSLSIFRKSVRLLSLSSNTSILMSCLWQLYSRHNAPIKE